MRAGLFISRVGGIPIVTDDLGRLAIARSDAKQLFVERAENEARKAVFVRLRSCGLLRLINGSVRRWVLVCPLT